MARTSAQRIRLWRSTTCATPALGHFPEGPHLFYEVKANLGESDIAALRHARVTAIQPGIESLSTALLRHLGKGTDAIHNLAVLKWCREHGLGVAWHQLVGIPGEMPADYAAQIALMKHIPQLPPPVRVNPIRIDRFSPYFDEHRNFGWERLEPAAEYRLLHPTLSPEQRAQVAHQFQGFGREELEPCFRDAFDRAVAEWQQRYKRGDGLYLHPQHGLIRKQGEQVRSWGFHSGLMKVLDCTHAITTRARVVEASGCAPIAIDQMAADGIVYVEGERVVNLVVRLLLGT